MLYQTRTGVADERVKIGNRAVAEANTKRAIHMLFYSKRSCALHSLENALRLHEKRRTCETIPLARTNGEHVGDARAMKAPLR